MTISFACPSCSAQMQFAETDAGQSGPCFQCGTIVTVPHRVPGKDCGPASSREPRVVAPNKTQVAVLGRIQKEAAKCSTEVLESKVLQLDEEPSRGELACNALKWIFLSGEGKIRCDRVLVAKLRFTFANNFTALLSVPCSGNTELPHEFASLVPGTLPSSLVLERSMLGGRWSGSDGGKADRFAKLAASDWTLSAGINWGSRLTVVNLRWGLQAMPVLPNKMLHIVHTGQQGFLGGDYGIRWYAERQKAFTDFVAKQHFEGQALPPIPKHSPLSLLFLDDLLSA